MTWVVAWSDYGLDSIIHQEIVHSADSDLDAALKLLVEKGYDLCSFHDYRIANFADLSTLQKHIYYIWKMHLSVIKI